MRLGLDNSHFWNIKQDTCAINLIEYTPTHGFIISHLNDTCHLFVPSINAWKRLIFKAIIL
jgi:hypothetical protein